MSMESTPKSVILATKSMQSSKILGIHSMGSKNSKHCILIIITNVRLQQMITLLIHLLAQVKMKYRYWMIMTLMMLMNAGSWILHYMMVRQRPQEMPYWDMLKDF